MNQTGIGTPNRRICARWKSGRQVGDPGPAGDADQAALEDRQHAERDDDRGDARDRRPTSPITPRRPAMPTRTGTSQLTMIGQPATASEPLMRGQHADQRADGDVDVAGDDDHRHADRGDRDIGVAEEDALQVALGQEARVGGPDRGEQEEVADQEHGLLGAGRSVPGGRRRASWLRRQSPSAIRPARDARRARRLAKPPRRPSPLPPAW